MDKTNAPTNASGLPRAAPIAGAIVLVAFGLGLVGYLEAGGASIATAVYDTLELFTLTFVVPRGAHGTSLPVVLEIARFLAPAVTVLAAAGVAARLFRDQFDRLTARRRVKRHAVVCGLGRVGSTVAAQLRAHGYSVLAIERDAANPEIGRARSLGIPVVVGDATSRDTLRRAGCANATRLVWSASEWVEGQVVVGTLVDTLRDNLVNAGVSRSTPERDWESAPACLVRVRDLALCTALRRDALLRRRDEEGVAPDVDFFNEAENAAQRLLWKATRGFALQEGHTVELWILGSGSLAEALIVQAARNWWGLPSEQLRPDLVIHLCSEDAETSATRLEALWPEVNAACRIERHAGPPEVAARGDFASPPHTVFVLVSDQDRAVEMAIRLVEQTSVPHVAVAAEPRYRPMVKSDRLLLFDPTAYGLESDVLLFDTYELFARMIHAHYLTTRLRPDGSLEPAVDRLDPGHEWGALDAFWRASNRDAARFVVPNLQDEGFGIRRLGAHTAGGAENQPLTRFGTAQLEAMAEREHERWRRFMAAEKWRLGPTKDSSLRTRPDLLPWSDASKAARTYTCDSIGDYPRLLAQLGYEVRPA